MRSRARRSFGMIAAAAGGAVVLRPGTHANRVARRQIDLLRRRLGDAGGRLRGVSYRLRGRRPDPGVADPVLADRVRSALGPIEKRLDLPRVHVMVERHVVLLHGDVGTEAQAREIEEAVGAVSGVRGVESHLHVGLLRSDTRPSAGHPGR
jgi:BON domain-containing protein